MGAVKEKQTLNEFTKALAREGINVILRLSAEGNVYGLTYIDFRTKCVFNGSDLGKEFSAKGILDCLSQQQKQEGFEQTQKQSNEIRQGKTAAIYAKQKQGQEQNHDKESGQKQANVLELLMKPEQSNNLAPKEFLQKKRKKKQSRGLRM